MNSSRKRSPEEVKTAGEKKKQKVTQPRRPHHGLYNQGATCYLNSVLQVLFMTPEIHDRLDPNSQTTDRELRNIFEKMKETTCGTENITKSLEIKNVYEQRDAAECLELILHKICPRASLVFQGELKHTTKCSRGHSINEEKNPFRTLPLSLKDTHDATYSVESGLHGIFQSKSFYGDNMAYCNECEKKTEATSRCEMVTPPHILTLLLKRFDFDYNTMSDVKSDRCVDVPSELQMKNKTYKLYGMVNHMGGLIGGHYTATILSNEDKTWYEFDDAHVNMVKEQPFARNRTYNSSAAYLLLYRASLRDEEKELDETRHQTDEERRHKHFEERIADDKENRRNQESRERMRREKTKEAQSHQVRGADTDAKHEKKTSRFNRDIREEDPFLTQQNSLFKPPDKNPRQRSNIIRDPVIIIFSLLGFALIVILFIIFLTTQ